MKRIVILTLIAIVSLFDLAESNPATLCIYGAACSGGIFGSCFRVNLEIRNRYRGEFTIRSGFSGLACSSDGVFCVIFQYGGWRQFWLQYANEWTYLPISIMAPPGSNSFCGRKNGREFWMDL